MRVPILTIVMMSLIVAACGPDTYDMKQTIEMGPFVFEVADASEKLDFFTGGGRYKKICVELLLHMEKSSPTNIALGDFLNGEANGKRMVVFPAMKIVDNEGKKFDGIVYQGWGKNRWRAEFVLVDNWRGNQSSVDYLDRHVHDFQLMIKNPNPRKGQPHRVTIKL